MKKKVRKSIKLLILTAIMAIFVGSMAVQADNIFSINFDSYTVNIGDENKLVLEIESNDDSQQSARLLDGINPKWVSWNENIATVDQVGKTGVVTPLRKGKAIISSGVGFPRETCVVTVVEPSIKLNKTAATIYSTSGKNGVARGKTVQLKANIKGADKTVKWTSSDTKIAVVDQNGLVTSKGEGEAVITAAANGQTSTCAVTVKEAKIDLNVGSVKLSTKGKGSSVKLVPTVVGIGKKVTWKSNNTKVATVSRGKITGKKTGQTYITATANGVETRCLVIVQEGLISIDEEQVTLYATTNSNGEKQFETKRLSTNASGTDVVTWSSNNENITVENGEIKPKATGEAVITAACNGKTDTCKVTVADTTTDIIERVVHLKTKGASKTYTLNYEVIGKKNAVKWTSSNKKVASVSKGKITAKKPGTATITADANGVKDTVTVTVRGFDPTITLNHSEYTLYTKGKGNSIALKAVVDGANKKVTWNSSDKNVAVVSAKGKVTIASGNSATPGRTLITAEANGVTAKCWIRVKESDITLEKNYYLLNVGEKDTIGVDIIGADQSAKYASSDKKTVTVDKNGNITGKKKGTAVIDIKANNVTKKCIVTVVNCTEHEWEQIPEADRENDDRPATCDKTGLTTYICKICGGKKQEVEPVLGHNFGRWTVEVKATETSAGLEKQVCSRCGAENTRSIPVKSKEDVADAYKLVWEDEFAGNELNTNDWNYEEHEVGWVNAELQEYVTSTDNTYVKDGMLHIKPIERKSADGKPITVKRTVDGKEIELNTYTSGRINTQNKQNFLYGRFEVRAKVPEGKGFLPAFWMMPVNESYYGQWPKCGEIDIMEVHGDKLRQSYGTLHFGDPHKETQGIYKLPDTEKNFAEDFHVFACEWDPGEFRYYVDDTLFFTENDWFTKREGFDEVAYPAPYDQEFYLILNLAVGGSWVGYPDEGTKFDDNTEFLVDYVRAYAKDSYDTDVDRPEKEVVFRDPDENGNYIKNGDFAIAEDLDNEDSYWNLHRENDGEGSKATISDKTLHISMTNVGAQNYSVQVVQAGVPMRKGAKYKLSYEAWADENRTMITGISGPDRGYVRYLNDSTVNLTTQPQPYEHEFTMNGSSDDANGRLEFNLGNQGSTQTVHISNVMLIMTEEPDVAEDKFLPDGNYVKNGSFDKGNEPGRFRLAYWDWNIGKDKDASVSVTNDAKRELKVVVPGAVTDANPVSVYQEGIKLSGGNKYSVSFDAYADRDVKMTTKLAGQTIESELTTESKSFKYEIETPADLRGDAVFELLFGAGGATYNIDNVAVRDDKMIVNGDFSSNMLGYEVYVHDAASVSDYIVDSKFNEENNPAFSIDITDTGDEEYYIQLKQNNIKLEKDEWYELSIDARSTKDRKITYALQRDGSKHKTEDGKEDWTAYAKETADLTADFKTFSVPFKMKEDSDDGTILSISMGNIGGRISEKHTVKIDNIVLKKIDPVVIPPLPAGTELIKDGKFEAGEEHWATDVISPAAAEVSYTGGQAKFNITNVGTADWNIKFRQKELVQMDEGATYQVKMKIKSSEARTVKYSLMTPSYAWYGGDDVALEAGAVKEIDQKITVGDGLETSKEITFAISMGMIEGKDTPASTIEISDISVVKVEGDTPTPDDPVEPDPNNLITNGNFAEGQTSWEAYVFPDEGAVAESTFTGNKARYEITNGGKADWHVQLKQRGLAMEKEATYKVTFEIGASIDRNIKVAFMDKADQWHGGADISLTKDKMKSVSRVITLDNKEIPEEGLIFQVSMGNKEKGENEESGENLAPHAIEIKNVSIVKVPADTDPGEDSEKPVTITPPAGAEKPVEKPIAYGTELIVNGDFEMEEESWVEAITAPGAASANFADGKASYTISNVGDEDWHVQLKQPGLKLEKGESYKVNLKIKSSKARTVKVALLDPEFDSYGGIDINLNANRQKSISKIVKVDKETSSEITFVISMGKIKDVVTPASVIEIDDISIKKVKSTTASDFPPNGEKEEPAPSEPESENLIQNGNFANQENWTVKGETTDVKAIFKDKTARFEIFNVGGSEDNVQLMQEALEIPTGKYRIQFKIASSADRKVKISLLGADDENKYTINGSSVSINLSANEEKSVNRVIQLGDNYTATKTAFVISMGKVGTITSDSHAIEISDVSIVKVDDGTTVGQGTESVKYKEVKPPSDEPENLIENGDFSKGEENWSASYIHNAANGGTAEATKAFTGNKARYEITNTGTNDWNIQLKQDGLVLEKGAKYKVNFKIASSINRQVKVAINKGDAWYAGADIDLEKNMLKSFSQIMTLNDDYTEGTVAFQISMGSTLKDKNDGLEAHAIEISNISITKVDDDAEADDVKDEYKEITPPSGSGDKPTPDPDDPDKPEDPPVEDDSELIENGNFAEEDEAKWSWSTYYKADAAKATRGIKTYSDDGKWLRYEITDGGANLWDIVLKQENLDMEKGAKYKVNFKIVSSIDRNVKVEFQDSDYQPRGATELIALEANKLKPVSRIVTVDNFTGKLAFQLSLGKFGEANTPHAIEITDISVVKVGEGIDADTEVDTPREIDGFNGDIGTSDPKPESESEEQKIVVQESEEAEETKIEESEETESTETEKSESTEIEESEETASTETKKSTKTESAKTDESET